MFNRQRLVLGNGSYDAMRERIDQASDDLEGFINFNGTSIDWPAAIEEQDNKITERIGESLGLSVISEIHGLGGADWKRIAQKGQQKKFDYGYKCADDSTYIELEAKGSCVHAGSPKNSKARTDIHEKKASLAARDAKGDGIKYKTFRYGTISVLSSNPGSTARCLLVDPAGDENEMPPRLFRLLTRIEYLHQWIAFFAPRSALAAAVSTRIADLKVAQNPFEFDGIALRDPSGMPYEIMELRKFISGQSRVSDGTAVGFSFSLSSGHGMFFLGLTQTIISETAMQDFESILKYKAPYYSRERSVECRLSKIAFEELEVAKSKISNFEELKTFVRFQLRGTIHYSEDGIAFGFLPWKNKRPN